ncbi:MAG: hypothetical protein GKR96_04280 [Gammaproteobacteria bacterium]|nr:hypothetical protein [Gammaproteobacteria bacterium]
MSMEQVQLSQHQLRVSMPCEVVGFGQIDGEPYVNVIPSIAPKNPPNTKSEDYAFDQIEEIQEVPILYPSTNRVAQTLPISAGDRGWLRFTDFDIEKWNIEDRKELGASWFHSLGDCIFEPGGYPRAKPIQDYSEEWFESRDLESTTRIAMKPGQVHLQAALWNLMLTDAGFDVVGNKISLLDTLALAFQAGAATNAALVLEPTLTIGKPVYAASALVYEKAVLAIEAIKGGATPPVRREVTNTRT